MGCVSRQLPSVSLMVSGLLLLFHESPRAACCSLCGQGFSSQSPGSAGCIIRRQHHGVGIPEEAGGHPLTDSQFRGLSHSLGLRGSSYTLVAPVLSGQVECRVGFVEPQVPGPRLRVDAVLRGVSPAPSPLAFHHRLVRDCSKSPSPGVLLAHGRSAVGRHGCDAPVVQRAPGLCLSSLWPASTGSSQSSAVQGVGAHPSSSVLDPTPLVSGPPGASGGGSLLPATKEGSSQTTAFPSLPPEPPRASADCVSFIQRSARHFGFFKGVASQLALCRRRSARVNYRSWCHRHGHSVSRPTVAKVADFLLYLRRSLSLSLSCSSIASYRSRLSCVFRFLLPELSSNFVLHYLLPSFRLERPLPSSHVPPWDLLSVLHFLRGSPFEPLSFCSLRYLIHKVLFLVSLATARRVGELQAVSSSVSFSGEDVYLSYLPEIHAKTESSVNPLPQSFCVCSLNDFVGDLPEELLLCPVRALRVYLSHTAFISPPSFSLCFASFSLSFSL